jgi:metallo-beta-lactamase superfamily protein
MIDCGLDWLGSFELLRPSAIVLTHAHPDHAWGLKNGAPCPVYAPKKTWQSLKNCQVEDRHLIKERVATKICGRIPRQRGPSVHFLRAGSDFHSRSIDRIEKRARLHWRRRDLHPLVHSQARRKADRACGYQRADRLVRESGRVASHYHSLRLGNCHRRRAQSRREPPRDGRRAWRRNAHRARPDGAGSAIKQIRCENCNDFV